MVMATPCSHHSPQGMMSPGQLHLSRITYPPGAGLQKMSRIRWSHWMA
jgi:hypothetical protein